MPVSYKHMYVCLHVYRVLACVCCLGMAGTFLRRWEKPELDCSRHLHSSYIAPTSLRESLLHLLHMQCNAMGMQCKSRGTFTLSTLLQPPNKNSLTHCNSRGTSNTMEVLQSYYIALARHFTRFNALEIVGSNAIVERPLLAMQVLSKQTLGWSAENQNQCNVTYLGLSRFQWSLQQQWQWQNFTDVWGKGKGTKCNSMRNFWEKDIKIVIL